MWGFLKKGRKKIRKVDRQKRTATEKKIKTKICIIKRKVERQVDKYKEMGENIQVDRQVDEWTVTSTSSYGDRYVDGQKDRK